MILSIFVIFAALNSVQTLVTFDTAARVRQNKCQYNKRFLKNSL